MTAPVSNWPTVAEIAASLAACRASQLANPETVTVRVDGGWTATVSIDGRTLVTVGHAVVSR
jgi:hypothetical protein